MYQQLKCLRGTTLKELLSSEGCLGPSRLSCSAFSLLVHGVLGPRQVSSEAFRMWLGWRLS
jgi:hypothetical protein